MFVDIWQGVVQTKEISSNGGVGSEGGEKVGSGGGVGSENGEEISSDGGVGSENGEEISSDGDIGYNSGEEIGTSVLFLFLYVNRCFQTRKNRMSTT